MPRWLLVAVGVASVFLNAGPRTAAVSAQAVDARQERVKASVARVFDSSVLHRIDIVIAPEDAPAIVNRTAERIRCTVTFDGVVLKDAGVRQAGGTFNRFVPIDGKPTPSVKFGEFVEIATSSRAISGGGSRRAISTSCTTSPIRWSRRPGLR